MKHSPGTVRDAIVNYLGCASQDASVAEIRAAVEAEVNEVPASSVRSYLRLRPDMFERTTRGRYRLIKPNRRANDGCHTDTNIIPSFQYKAAELFHRSCFDWIPTQPNNSVHAVVTDPPYGLVEYSEKEQDKLRNGSGGVWRIPPSFDGHRRSPLPRFTTLREQDLKAMHIFFGRLGRELFPVLVPGAHIFVASNPLVSHIVASALSDAGLESRGMITRLVMTMRGGDRPKNAHDEFSDVSVMPRSMSEPWLLFRKPVEGRVQDNLRKWGTGGLKRISSERPFGDVIRSHPTRPAEKKLAPHPSLKPQAFLRQIVRAALPLDRGTLLDPFAGSGSTLAAANYLGYKSVGVEADARYVELAKDSIPKLEEFICPNTPS